MKLNLRIYIVLVEHINLNRIRSLEYKSPILSLKNIN